MFEINIGMERKAVFITGATGLLGSYLTKTLLDCGCQVYVLARGDSKETAEQRMVSALKFWGKDIAKEMSGLHILRGDIKKENFGFDDRSLDLLNNKIIEIFHCAASIQFNLPLETSIKNNLEGTRNILQFALLCKNLQKVNHISTAYVCGDYGGIFTESNLDVGQTFPTTYQQSKFEAEKLVLDYRENGLWVDIYRPPFVVGEFETGKTITFHAFYQAFSLWRNEIFDVFPGRDYRINIVPVDILVQAIITIAFNTKTRNGTYHPFPLQPVSLGEIFDLANSIAHFKTKLINSMEFNFDCLTPVQKIIMKNNIFSFNSNVSLDSTKTNEILNSYGFIFPEFDKKMFFNLVKYAIDKNTIGNIKG